MKIFLDSADAAESQQAKDLIKAIDGQTTNPSLLLKNPEIATYLASGKKFTSQEALNQYKKIVENISQKTKGPISIQVIADNTTTVDDLLNQARIYKTWAENAVVKFPIIPNGLEAASIFCKEGAVNLTLNFTQTQAAAIYQATKNTKYPVFISPFVGRLDAKDTNGMDLVKNILQMFISFPNNHLQVITSSVRNLDHLLYAVKLNSPFLTAPLSVIQEWKEHNLKIPDENYLYPTNLQPIPYQEIALNKNWQDYDISHPLTTLGVEKFMLDWKMIME